MGWVVNATPGCFAPPKDPVPLYRRLVRSWTGLDVCGKILLPPGFDPLTIQSVVNHYPGA